MKIIYLRQAYGIKSAFRDPVTGLLRRHTFLRLANFLLLQISGLLKLDYALGFPVFFNIEPTNNCNLACPFCSSGTGFGKRKKGFMPLVLFKKIVDEVALFAYKISLYNLGEPFLHNDIFEMINYAAKKNISVSLATNGTLLDKAQIGRLIGSGCEELIFSIDAATPETYGKLRRGGDFSKLKENISYLLHLRNNSAKATPKVSVNFIVTSENELEMADFLKMGQILGVDICSFSLMWKQELGNSQQEKLSQELLPVFKPELNRYKSKAGRKGSCPWIWKKTIINWDGDVVPCCYDYNSTAVMGNIQDRPLRSIWNNRDFRHFRSMVKKDKARLFLCSRCPSL